VIFRDRFKTIYFGSGTIKHKDACNSDIAEYQMPESVIKEYLDKEGAEVIEEYGPPIISVNGDIYTWKRTPEKYSILKWTWRDNPDSPIRLKSIPSKKTISLAWAPPEEDAAKIKEYEIIRSTELCDPFVAVGAGNLL